MMDRTPDKRPAFEASAVLLRPPRFDPGMKRPATTTVGAFLVLLRTVLSATVLVGAAIGWDGFLSVLNAVIDVFGVDDLAADASDEVAFGATLCMLAFNLLLSVLVLLGKNWPRVTIMAFAAADVLVAFSAWISAERTLATSISFQVLALDILILLAMSSRSAASYARRFEEQPGRA
ncbi:hypothetical protein VR010_03625 [Actinomycetaceae bacterium L2_0104]